jgi:hypothetical protein
MECIHFLNMPQQKRFFPVNSPSAMLNLYVKAIHVKGETPYERADTLHRHKKQPHPNRRAP